MLKTSAKEFLIEKGPIEKLRRLRDTKDATGYDQHLWKKMAEMGWASLNIPEAYGGLDFGYTGLGQVLEESGRTLTASPLISSALLSATAINLGGSDSQKKELLGQIASGTLVATLALEESKHHNPDSIHTTVKKSGNGYVINGTKLAVIDGLSLIHI